MGTDSIHSSIAYVSPVTTHEHHVRVHWGTIVVEHMAYR